MNGDRFADLAAVGSGRQVPGTLFVRMGASALAAATAIALGHATTDRAGPGDIDGDGFADLVTLLDVQGTLKLVTHFGAATGVRGATHEIDLGPVDDVAIVKRLGDIDDDGFADVVTYLHPAEQPGRGRVFRGDPAGLVAAWDAPEARVSLGDGCDVDGDGFDDMVVAEDGGLTVRHGNGALGTRSAFVAFVRATESADPRASPRVV